MSRVRILLAKPGLDGHDQGVHMLARAFRDAGFEVIMTGRFWTPEAIAQAAVDEDVDLTGLSILSGAHLGLTADVIRELSARQATCGIIVGGTILDRDIQALLDLGCEAVFPVGSRVEDMVAWIGGAAVALPAPKRARRVHDGPMAGGRFGHDGRHTPTHWAE